MNPSPTVAVRVWHSGAIETLLQDLGSSPAGLTAPEAAQRLAANGPNALAEGQTISPMWIFLAQFKSLIIWILIAAGALSAALGDWVDASAILAIVLLNAGIGLYQEFHAEQSIAALRKMTAPLAKVRRDGQVALVPAAGVVAGYSGLRGTGCPAAGQREAVNVSSFPDPKSSFSNLLISLIRGLKFT